MLNITEHLQNVKQEDGNTRANETQVVHKLREDDCCYKEQPKLLRRGNYVVLCRLRKNPNVIKAGSKTKTDVM